MPTHTGVTVVGINLLSRLKWEATFCIRSPAPDFPACCVESAHLPKRKLRAFALQDEKGRGGFTDTISLKRQCYIS